MKKEEKAEEYSKARYVNYIEQYNVLDKIDLERFSKEDFIAGADYIQHLNRWRKVEEELPEYYKQVLVKLTDGEILIGYYINHRYRDDSFYSICDNGIEFIIEGVTEWKPIN